MYHRVYFTHHEDIKLIEASEWSLHGLPERHDEAHSCEGPLTARECLCVLGCSGRGSLWVHLYLGMCVCVCEKKSYSTKLTMLNTIHVLHSGKLSWICEVP